MLKSRIEVIQDLLAVFLSLSNEGWIQTCRVSPDEGKHFFRHVIQVAGASLTGCPSFYLPEVYRLNTLIGQDRPQPPLSQPGPAVDRLEEMLKLFNESRADLILDRLILARQPPQIRQRPETRYLLIAG